MPHNDVQVTSGLVDVSQESRITAESNSDNFLSTEYSSISELAVALPSKYMILILLKNSYCMINAFINLLR